MGLVGQRIRRVEDPALVRGEARYVGDLPIDALELAFVRSPVAHARIVSIDVSAALALPGVHLAFTYDDVSSLPGFAPVPVPDEVLRPPLANGVTRFVGEPIVAIVADSQAIAADAAEQVIVEFDPLDSVIDVEAAMRADAPKLFSGLESNIVVGAVGAEVDVSGDADIAIDVWFDNQRLAVAPLEPNNIVADARGGHLQVYVSTQSPHAVRDSLAGLLQLDQQAVQVLAPAVGGGFGAKSLADAEYQIACVASQRLARPVRWRQARGENLLTMHGRSQRQHVKLAARRDGTITAIHADLMGDGGAYPAINAYLAFMTARMLSGVYTIPTITHGSAAIATNTAPPTAYRGAGRPEAACLVERAVDILACELGLDPVELRRKNLIPSDRFPYEVSTGVTYDCGDYEAALDRVLELSAYGKLRAEQARRRAAGDRTLLGIGVSVYVEITAGMGATEFAHVEVHENGQATVKVGTFSHGQGHRTSFAQIAADALGLPLEAVTVLDGDTTKVKRGTGTYASRSIQVGGTAVHVASTNVATRARELAAELLEAASADIVIHEGRFTVAGVPARSIGWSDVVRMAVEQRDGDGERIGLFSELDWERPNNTFPFGAHVAAVEVDQDTGQVRLIDHFAVDDCGSIINPLLADGQVHGGVAQGAAQALYEQVVYDVDGNVLTSNLADYAFVSAAELPSFTIDHTVTPTYINPLGAKGIGESGTIGATASVHNAVIDALSHLGVRHIDMPCTAERVWRAINGDRDDGRLSVWRR